MKLRIATRKSQLALTQTRWVGTQLQALQPGLQIEEVHVVTEGDRIQDVSLAKFGGKGLFVSEVEAALLDGRADIAVHSMKDLPTQLADGLIIGCVPPREDPRDALLSKEGGELDDLMAGAKIGTSSLRRTSQLRAHRNDLQYALLRGNVDTRLRKLDAGEYDAIVLALAGLRRLNLHHRPLHAISPEVSIPAVGQGALAIEARQDAKDVLSLLARFDHVATRVCVQAERAFLSLIEGGCHAPVAAHARFENDGALIRIDAMVGSVDGEKLLRASSDHWVRGEDAEGIEAEALRLGKSVARTLLDQGAKALLEEARKAAAMQQAKVN